MPRKFWLITDTHFKHKNMIQKSWRIPDYESRIFQGITENVKPGDIIIHLGDFNIGQDLVAHEEWFQFLRYNGNFRNVKTWLILGNHDKKSMNWYLDRGWDWVGYNMRIKMYGQRILFSHIPQKDTGEWDINFHGHFHDSDHRVSEPRFQEILGPKHRLLALEWTGYKPVELETAVLKGLPVGEVKHQEER